MLNPSEFFKISFGVQWRLNTEMVHDREFFLLRATVAHWSCTVLELSLLLKIFAIPRSICFFILSPLYNILSQDHAQQR